LVIGIEDIVYCAAFCHEKLNILFLQPSNYFTGLFRETVGVTVNKCNNKDVLNTLIALTHLNVLNVFTKIIGLIFINKKNLEIYFLSNI
jgi:hypothetical protein